MPPAHQVVRLLGRGGMGAVFLVEDLAAQRRLALKTALGWGDEIVQARFVTEVRATARLRHPAIISVHTRGRLPTGEFFYTMPVVEGTDLDAWLDRVERPGATEHRRYDLDARIALLSRVARAVGCAHRAGIVHRDLKPGNVMVGLQGEVWVVDWGLARRLDAEEAPHTVTGNGESPVGHRLSLAGAAMGTPGYMAPEQVRGDLDAIGPPSDVHALGAILYLILAGVPPYYGDKYMDIFTAIARHALFPPSRRAPERRIPRPLEAIALRALAALPRDRHPDGDAFARDLEDWLARRPVPGLRYSARERAALWVARRPGWAAIAVSGLVVALLLGLLVATETRAARRTQEELDLRLAASLREDAARARTAFQDQLAAYRNARKELVAAFRTAVRPYRAVYSDPGEAARHIPPVPPDPEGVLEGPYPRWRSAGEQLAMLASRAGEHLESQLQADRRAWAAARGAWLELASLSTETLLAASRDPVVASVFPPRGELRVGPLPPGCEAELLHYDTDPRHAVYPLASVRAVPPSGARLELPMGSYVLQVRRGREEFLFPALVERSLAAEWFGPPVQAQVEVRLPTPGSVPEGFVWCAGGVFLAGGSHPNAFVRHRSRVGPFCLARSEVTFREYIRFLQDGAPREHWPVNKYTDAVRPVLGPDFRFLDRDVALDHPVFGISVYAAEAYVRWRTLKEGRRYRLPADLEWEYAARGADGRRFPWGDRWDPSLAKLPQSPRREKYQAPVGTHPQDRSPFGVLDLGGNLREWVAAAQDDWRVLRGGFFAVAEAYGPAATRYLYGPAAQLPNTGFRLAVDPH